MSSSAVTASVFCNVCTYLALVTISSLTVNLRKMTLSLEKFGFLLRTKPCFITKKEIHGNGVLRASIQRRILLFSMP